MATFRQLTDDKNALCYVWLSFALLILSVVCFGVASYQTNAVYGGVFFLVLSVLTAILYMASRWSAKHPNGKFCESSCCGCCSCGECCLCCSNCCRFLLCLPPSQASIQRHRQLAIRRHRNRNRDTETHVVVMNHLGYEISIPTNVGASEHRQTASMSTMSKLRTVESDIHRLFQQFSYLQTDASISNSLRRDYNELLHQHEVLSGWIEHRTSPSTGEMQRMKSTVKKIQRNFRIAQASRNSDNSVRADMSEPLQITPSTSTAASASIYTTDLAGLPPYQVEDPLNRLHSQQGKVAPNSSQELGPPRSNPSSITPVGDTDLARASHGASRFSTLSVSAQMGSMSSLAPPVDESDAPPTYEEAVSTVV